MTIPSNIFVSLALSAVISSFIFGFFVQNYTVRTERSIMASSTSSPDDLQKKLQDELRNNPIDPNSFSRADQAVVKHVKISWLVDFEKYILSGEMTATVKKVSPNVTHLFLDTVDLTILNVVNANKEKLSYRLYPAVEGFGSKLEIDISGFGEQEFTVTVAYNSKPSALALQWLTPEQTDGKVHPFMFSQCEAINARSILPCQDTPSVKASYEAQVQAPAELEVLMSGKITKQPTLTSDGRLRVHYFEQKVPIPSYLIAIAVGDLASRKIGKISHVWAERGVVDKAAWEFAEIDKILAAAEHFAGPYVWEIYDVLVLPPSFPYGGMENPSMTFATPSLLAGDRSLVYVIAHEISHSWTGNLVTNANFGHFWLNEGFTTFLERKISGYMSKHGEKFRQLMALEGLEVLKDVISSMGENNPASELLIDVRGINPDEVFSSVPYEKGHTFLFYLEQLLGGPSVFEPFLRDYIQKFKYKSIVTEDFKDYIYEYFNKTKLNELNSVDWDGWFHKPGYPLVIPKYDTTLLNESLNLAQQWKDAKPGADGKIDPAQFNPATFKALEPIQQKLFLLKYTEMSLKPANEAQKDKNDLIAQKLQLMSEQYNLNKVVNTEVRCSWILLGLKSHWEPIMENSLDFLSVYGRVKYIGRIYRALFEWKKQLAIDTFNSNRHKMMQFAIDQIEQELGLKKVLQK